MRIIQKRNYWIGTKIPYSQWPELIHRYLLEQGLSSQKFLYYFDDIVSPWMAKAEDGTPDYNHGCMRLIRDLPEIGLPREIWARKTGLHHFFLSNIDTNEGCSESQIMPLINRIHRSYRLSDCDLYYLDIDFFSDMIPAERSLKKAERLSRQEGQDLNPLIFLEHQPYGSGFRLHRDLTADNYLSLSIDILHHGKVMNPKPYFSAMQELLPGIRYSEKFDIYTTDKEQEEFDRRNEAARPTIERCEKWLEEKLPGVPHQNYFDSRYNLAPKLKKLAKLYGYTYSFQGNGIYLFEIKTKNGHIFHIIVDSGPSHHDTGFILSFQGLGFQHWLRSVRFTPTNQQEFDACAEHVLDVVEEFRQEMLPALDACWPPTPDWFIPAWWI